MIQKHLQHHGHYHLALFLILLLGVVFAYYAREDKQIEMIILISIASIYMLFGIIHHYLMHDLSAKIVIEYIAMGSLGIAVAFFVFRGKML
jgi:hypothetical protein